MSPCLSSPQHQHWVEHMEAIWARKSSHSPADIIRGGQLDSRLIYLLAWSNSSLHFWMHILKTHCELQWHSSLLLIVVIMDWDDVEEFKCTVDADRTMSLNLLWLCDSVLNVPEAIILIFTPSMFGVVYMFLPWYSVFSQVLKIPISPCPHCLQTWSFSKGTAVYFSRSEWIIVPATGNCPQTHQFAGIKRQTLTSDSLQLLILERLI